MLNDLFAPILSLTVGATGAKFDMFGAPVIGEDITFKVHSFETVPLALVAVAFTIHVPCFALVFVYFALVALTLDWTSVPLIYQFTLTF